MLVARTLRPVRPDAAFDGRIGRRDAVDLGLRPAAGRTRSTVIDAGPLRAGAGRSGSASSWAASAWRRSVSGSGKLSGSRRTRLFMLRISSTAAMAIKTMMNRPIGPARPPDRVSPKLLTATTKATTQRYASARVHRLPDAGEEVGLRDRDCPRATGPARSPRSATPSAGAPAGCGTRSRPGRPGWRGPAARRRAPRSTHRTRTRVVTGARSSPAGRSLLLLEPLRVRRLEARPPACPRAARASGPGSSRRCSRASTAATARPSSG